MVEKNWLTINEAAEYLCSDVSYLKEQMLSEGVPYSEFGDKALFNQNRLDEWLLSKEKSTPQAGHQLIKKIINKFNLKAVKREGYTNIYLGGRNVKAQLHLYDENDVCLVLAEHDQSIPQLKKLETVALSTNLSGYYEPNKAWLERKGQFENSKSSKSIAYKIPIAEGDDEGVWGEIEQLLEYAKSK